MKYLSRCFVLVLLSLTILLSVTVDTQAGINETKEVTPDGYWRCYDDGSILPCHNSLYSIEIISDSDAWAVGANGTILHWDGVDWNLTPAPTTQAIADIDMLSSNDGWAVGGYGTILHWNGINWTLVETPTSDSLMSIDMFATDDGWAVGDYGVALRWNGSTWTEMPRPTSGWLNSVDMISTDNIWAVGYKNDNDKFFNWNGSTWSEYSSPVLGSLNDIDMVSATDGWAVGDYFGIFHWDGTKWTWFLDAYPSWGYFDDITMNSSTDGWAVGSYGSIIHWNGTEWEHITGLDSERPNLRSVHIVDNKGWIVGEGSTIINYDGTKWTDINGPFIYDFRDVDFSSINDGWAVGERGVISHWNGSTWTSEDSPTFPSNYPLNSVVVISENNAWAIDGTNLLNWNGNEWAIFSNKPDHPYTDIDWDGTNIWITGGLYSSELSSYIGKVSRWDGVTWHTTDIPNLVINSISMINDSIGWIAGENWQSIPTIFRWDGTNWNEATWLLYPLSDIDAYDANTVWAIGSNEYDQLYSSSFNESTWNLTLIPNDTRNPYDIEVVDPFNVWAVGSGGMIYNWRGTAWEKLDQVTGKNLYGISMLSNEKGWIVGSDGVILEYITPSLTINYSDGAVGSYFNLFGADFPPSKMASIYINDQLVGSIQVKEDGTFTFTLSTTGVEEGTYSVKVTVNPSATTSFILDNDADLRPKVGDYPVFIVENSLILKQIYLPLLQK